MAVWTATPHFYILQHVTPCLKSSNLQTTSVRKCHIPPLMWTHPYSRSARHGWRVSHAIQWMKDIGEYNMNTQFGNLTLYMAHIMKHTFEWYITTDLEWQTCMLELRGVCQKSAQCIWFLFLHIYCCMWSYTTVVTPEMLLKCLLVIVHLTVFLMLLQPSS